MHQHPFAKLSNAKNQEQDAVDISSRPIGELEFADLLGALGPFEDNPTLAIALSGGADSVCLCLLCQRWCQSTGGKIKALLVDHGLRESSGLEGKLVAGWMKELGVPFQILTWHDNKPETGIQSNARNARYRLLEEECRKLGILHVLTAHHFDDQAETVEMRRLRASGTRGLAGMAAIVERDCVRLIRPLLPIAKSRLIATLRQYNHAWIDDPSNRNLRFERSRLRETRLSKRLPSPMISRDRAAERRSLELRSAHFLATHASPHPLGFVSIDREDLQALDQDLSSMVLQRCIQAVSGSIYPVGFRKIIRLIEQAAIPSKNDRHTIGGTIVTFGNRHVRIIREPAAIYDRKMLSDNSSVVWDKRFKLRYNGTVNSLMVSKAGDTEIDAISKLVRKKSDRIRFPRTVLRGLPCIGSERHGSLMLGPYRLKEAISERISIMPYSRNPLAGASFALVTVA